MYMSLYITLASVFCMTLSGVPGLFFSRRGMTGQRIAMLLNLLATLLGGAALLMFVSSGSRIQTLTWPWSLPWGRFGVGLDCITALFLMPVLGISIAGSIYAMEYWKQNRHPGNGRKLRLCWGIMNAAMMMVVLARDGVLFLMAWEVMALAAFFLITTEDHDPGVHAAGWIYLIAAHIGIIALVAMVVLMRLTTGSFDLWITLHGSVPSAMAAAMFILALVGFGLKAGIMPLHVWLPGAHANAPSHVSALFSGVMLNIGIYGLLRFGETMTAPPLWWGLTLLILGAGSAVVGMIFAVCQNDYKRLLAYSSVENMGIVCMGLGLALIGRSVNRPDLIVLGLGGALFHVLNHSLFKPLLFMGAGNLLHATHTRKIDSLGGLAAKMPITAILFFTGALAICGLPGLNGFLSEWLIYLGLLRTATVPQGGTLVWISLAAGALAATGALAVAGFVKLTGSVFLGNKRSDQMSHAHDPGAEMLLPMGILASGCCAMALFPDVTMPFLARAIHDWAPRATTAGGSIGALAPLHEMAIVNAVLLLAAAAIGSVLWAVRKTRAAVRRPTWSCACARTSSRMQYTGASFSRMLAQMFSWMIPNTHAELPVPRYCPQPMEIVRDVPDVVLDRGLIPCFALTRRLLARLRPLQNKPVNMYLAYMLAILLLLLLALGF